MFENVNKELLEKAMKAGSKEDALNILKQGGVELTAEDLQNITKKFEECLPTPDISWNKNMQLDIILMTTDV